MPGPSAVEGRKATKVPTGLWGLLLLVATEGAFFGTLIASYFYLRFNAEVWPPEGIEPPGTTLPVVLTLVLLLSAAPMVLAGRLAQDRRLRAVVLVVLAATLVQAAYLGVQVWLFFEDLEKFGVDETAYGSIYFTMLAAHHLHVAAGLAANLWLLARLAGGLTTYRARAVRVVGWYWVFVAAVAVGVVFAQVSPA